MQMGGAVPGSFVPILLARNAPLPRPVESPVMASAQGNLGIAAAARQMRRLFGPCGGADRRDV